MHRAQPLLRLGIALFFAQSAFHIYSASLPLYFAGLGFDPTLIGLLIGAAGVAELVGALAVGPAIDRFGGRALLVTGAACYLLASLGFMVFAAVPVLALLRLLLGFGLAAVVPSTYSFVPHLVKARAQTVAFATLGAAGNVAAAICPLLGLALLQNIGPPDVAADAGRAQPPQRRSDTRHSPGLLLSRLRRGHDRRRQRRRPAVPLIRLPRPPVSRRHPVRNRRSSPPPRPRNYAFGRSNRNQ
jgi:MFS family permease